MFSLARALQKLLFSYISYNVYIYIYIVYNIYIYIYIDVYSYIKYVFIYVIHLCSSSFVVGHVAAMADVHLGKGATVGSVFAFKNLMLT
jgi:hypothetical protein